MVLFEHPGAENTRAALALALDAANKHGLDIVVSDLDSDEVLSKAQIEHDTGNITADVLQTKDVNGSVFYEWYNQGILEPFYPRDICAHIDEGNLKYSYPLYASQAF